MQIVYISNRPKVILETLQHVAFFMPFIDQVLICVPDAQANQFSNQKTILPITVLVESEILSDIELNSLKDLDHQRRNYLLRSRLVEHSEINDQFIMSDDDSRPLKTIDSSRYYENGKYHRYYFYDMRYWDNNQTDFDAGQISTCAVLGYNNLPNLSYASHMPQIIDKVLYLGSVNFFKQYSVCFPICEWSSYFNYTGMKHPDRFHKAKAYMTLCWPEHPLSWKLFIQPSDYLFENYSTENYQPNKIFKNYENNSVGNEQLSTTNIQKIVKWKKYSISCKHPEQANGIIKYMNPRTWVNKLLKHMDI